MKLSIVTINLNNANGLENTLKSINKQSDQNYELIVIDGHSTDNSLEVAKNYNKIITKLITERDEGIFYAQNKGFRHSTGEYILFLNSGDLLADSSVIKKFNALNEKRELIIGDIIFDLGKIKWRRFYNSTINDIFFFLESLPHSSTFIKRELLEITGAYNLEYKVVADYDFFINSIINHKCSYSFLRYPISIFNKEGISSNELPQSQHIIERNEVFIKHFGKERFEQLNKKNTYYHLFYKKIPYIYDFIKSYFSLNIK